MTAQEYKLHELTADFQSKSGRKNCFRIARQMAREGRDVISVCCMKNDAGNVVSDADGRKNIWRKYMGKIDLPKNIVKEGCIPDDWRKSILVSVYKGKGDPLVCGSYRAIQLVEQPMKVLERVLEKRVRCQLITCSLASCLEREPLMPF